MTLLLLTTMATPLLANEIPPPSWYEQELARLEAQRAAAEAARQAAEREAEELRRQLENAGTGLVRLVTPQNIILEAGETIEVDITVRNVGSRNVQNLFTIAVPSAESPFTVEFLRNTNSVGSMGANVQRTMAMRITVNENADAGAHTIALNHSFRDAIGEMTTSTDTINVRIEGTVGTPNIVLGNFQTFQYGPLAPEQSFTLSAIIRNLGDAPARDVRVSLPDNMRAEDNIFITSDLNNALFSTMEAGHSSTLHFTFQASPNIATGAYTIAFNINYRDEDNTPQTAVIAPFIINAYAPEEDEYIHNIEIRNMTAPTARLNVGQTGNISFYLHNSGEVEARNVRVTATPEEAAIVPMTANIQVIPVLAAGESRAVSFSFAATDRAITRSYAIGFRTTFDIGRTGDSGEFEQFAALNIYNPDEEEDDDVRRTQIPRVHVHDISFYPEMPRAGQPFDINVTFRNTSDTRSVNNILIELDEILAANVPGQQQNNMSAGFTPVGGSNSFVIDFLPPNGQVSKVLRYTTHAQASSGTHNMRFTFEFQDQDFVEHSSTQQISIPVAQVTRLELADVSVSETSSVGGSVWFQFTIINSGHVNLSSVRVRTEGPFDVSDAGGETGRFIGNIPAQRMASADGRFTPLEAGQHQGSFIVYAEDTTGEIISISHPFTIFVEGGWDEGFAGGDWGEAWGDYRGEGMMHFPEDGGWGMEEPAQENRVAQVLLSVFTREVAPDWWDSNQGDFAQFGIEGETVINWPLIIIAVVLIAGTAAPIIFLVARKRRSAMDFDDED